MYMYTPIALMCLCDNFMCIEAPVQKLCIHYEADRSEDCINPMYGLISNTFRTVKSA